MAQWARPSLSQRSLLAALMVAAAGLFLFLLPGDAEATHFRGGTMYAHTEDPNGDPYTARIYLIVYIRNTYATNTAQVGQTVGEPCNVQVPNGPPNQLTCMGTDVGAQPGCVGCAGYPAQSG